MNQYLEMLLITLVVLTFNILDSVTTSLCFKQYPDKDMKGEGNPIMRLLMVKDKALAEIVKHTVGIAVISILLIMQDVSSLRWLAIALGLVVLNNTYVYLSRKITKQKMATPFEKLRQILHFPNFLMFPIAMFILLTSAYFINTLF